MAITTVLSNLHIPQRLRSLGNSSAQKELEQLRQEARIGYRALDLALVGAYTPLYKLVKFYQIVSPWCDRSAELQQLEQKLDRIDYGQYLKARQALLALAAREERDLYGVNRTHSGEPPTAKNIFLGNRCGLSTKTVDYWERMRGAYTTQPALSEPDSPTIMDVIDAQASNLLEEGLARWKSPLQDLINS